MHSIIREMINHVDFRSLRGTNIVVKFWFKLLRKRSVPSERKINPMSLVFDASNIIDGGSYIHTPPYYCSIFRRFYAYNVVEFYFDDGQSSPQYTLLRLQALHLIYVFNINQALN